MTTVLRKTGFACYIQTPQLISDPMLASFIMLPCTELGSRMRFSPAAADTSWCLEHPRPLPPPSAGVAAAAGASPEAHQSERVHCLVARQSAHCMGPSWDTSTPFSGGLAFFLILQCNQGAQGPFAGRIGKSDAQPQEKEVPAQTRVQKLRGMILRKPLLFDCRPVRPKCNSCVSKL